jgi:hypothetical protein
MRSLPILQIFLFKNSSPNEHYFSVIIHFILMINLNANDICVGRLKRLERSRSSPQRPSPPGWQTHPRNLLSHLRSHADFLFHDSQSTEYIRQIGADHLIHILLVVHRIFHHPVSLISPRVPLDNTIHRGSVYFILTSSLGKKGHLALEVQGQ